MHNAGEDRLAPSRPFCFQLPALRRDLVGGARVDGNVPPRGCPPAQTRCTLGSGWLDLPAARDRDENDGTEEEQVRDFKRSEKEFPLYRKEIEARGWVPHVLSDTNAAYWDGFTGRDWEGQPVGGLSDAGRKQMIRMILDGYFGDEVKDAFVDQDRYWKIRDNLITRPNQDVIAREGLHVLDVIRKA